MGFNFEQFAKIPEKLNSNENREAGQRELAEMMATIIGDYSLYVNANEFRKEIEFAIASFPAQERQNIITELQKITSDAGWKTAHNIVMGELNLDREIENVIGDNEQVAIYHHTIKQPKDIKNLKDFLGNEDGPVQYWIPRKYDIKRYIQTAVEVHERSGKTGAIKILDIGGGAGFMGKLIADEAKNQNLDLEVIVIDPDTETVTKAQEIYSDTKNLKFEIGTSEQALEMFGPEFADNEKSILNELKGRKLELLEAGKKELSYINALLIGLEGENDLAEAIDNILSGSFGNRAQDILKQSGVELNNLPSSKDAYWMIADFYEARFESYQQEIATICDKQEEVYREKGIGQGKIDVVLNSWMPVQLDFTREIRMLNASAIIYAREITGATGAFFIGRDPRDLGNEISYSKGEGYESISEWEGVANGAIKGDGSGYLGHIANVSEIQINKSVNISEEDLKISIPSEDEKYAWEESLAELIGLERIENCNFYGENDDESVDYDNDTVDNSLEFYEDAEIHEKPKSNEELYLFLDFLEKHRQELDARVLAGEKLSTIIYKEFYNCDKDDLLWADGNSETERIKKAYQIEFLRIEEEFNSQQWDLFKRGDHKSLSIKTRPYDYWLQIRIHEGLNVRNDTIGRLYFNCNVERAPDFFKKLSDNLVSSGIRAEMKIPRNEDAHSLNRFDKMLLYFNSDDEKGVLRIVDEMYEKNRAIFKDKKTPQFTGKIRNAKGEIMQGIGFGEEPVAYDESFGNIRAEILAELFREAEKNGYFISNFSFDIENKFQELCKKHGVDSENPAFNNVRKNNKDFTEIRMRCERSYIGNTKSFEHPSVFGVENKAKMKEIELLKEKLKEKTVNIDDRHEKESEMAKATRELRAQNDEKIKKWKEANGII